MYILFRLFLSRAQRMLGFQECAFMSTMSTRRTSSFIKKWSQVSWHLAKSHGCLWFPILILLWASNFSPTMTDSNITCSKKWLPQMSQSPWNKLPSSKLIDYWAGVIIFSLIIFHLWLVNKKLPILSKHNAVLNVCFKEVGVQVHPWQHCEFKTSLDYGRSCYQKENKIRQK